MGPLDLYQTAVSKGDIQSDVAQLQAMERLQSLYLALTKQENEPGLIAKLFAKPKRELIPGLYFWGGVGRGKTFLMDLFFDSLPFEQKSRMHFHRFMRHVHRALTDLQGEADPLRKIALDFADKNRVLCFDEFFVSDITDAMILGLLLEELFARGVCLVATSNIVPDQLYLNGLQRQRFLPAIALLNKHCKVVNVDGGIDHRLRALEKAELYHSPLDADADRAIQATFESLVPVEGETKRGVDLDVEGRPIPVLVLAEDIVWFDFSAICEGPRSQNDYIEIAREFHAVMISNVPALGLANDDAARRFINLVDEFYDRSVKLALSASEPLASLYSGGRLEFEFARTESRLLEMQSREYLARPHRP